MFNNKLFANYIAWQVRPESFPKGGSIEEQLKFFLHFAVLAPSSHNSQPWKFCVKDGSIKVYPEWKRALPLADEDNRLLFIALGCAIANIRIAADYFGFDSEVCYCLESVKEAVAVINFKSTMMPFLENHKRSLIDALINRRTNRSHYKAQLPSSTIMEALSKLSDSDIQISIVSDSECKKALAKLIVSAREEAMDNVHFRYELANYKKYNLTKSPIGMPGFDMGFSITASLVLPWIIRWKNVARMTAKKELSCLQDYTPILVVISTTKDNLSLRLRAGEVLERALIFLEQQGIATAITIAATQVKNYYQEAQRIVGTTFRPQVCFRLGFSVQVVPHSPRLMAEEVLISC